MVNNYIGLCKCIEDDFKYFCDVKYLKLRQGPKMKLLLGDNQNDNELWIFIFSLSSINTIRKWIKTNHKLFY